MEPRARRGIGPEERWLIWLMIGAVFIATAVAGMRPTASYRALSLGAGPFEIGQIAAAYALLGALLALPVGRLTDRIGERPVMLAGIVLATAAASVVPLTSSIAGLALCQAGLGVGFLLFVVGAHTMLARRGMESNRAERIGWYGSAASLGHVLGPGAAGILVGSAPDGSLHDGIFLVGAALAVVALMAVWRIPAEAPVSSHGDHGARHARTLDTLRLPGVRSALIAGVTVVTTVDLLVVYMPAYGEALGVPPELIGTALATLAVSQMVSRVSLGWVVRRFGHMYPILGSLLLAGGVVPLLAISTHPVQLIGIMGVAGIGLGLGQPLTFAWLTSRVPRAGRGSLMGIRVGANRTAELVAPLAVGLTAGMVGLVAMFWWIVAGMGVSSVLVVLARDSLRNPAVIPSNIPEPE